MINLGFFLKIYFVNRAPHHINALHSGAGRDAFLVFVSKCPVKWQSVAAHGCCIPNCSMPCFVTSFLVVMGSIVISVSVCMSDLISQKISRPNFTKFPTHVTDGRGSVFVWWQCDVLSTSGFVDDVMFSHGHNTSESKTTCMFVCLSSPTTSCCLWALPEDKMQSETADFALGDAT